LLAVPDEAAAFHDPGEAALHDPAPADDDEAFHPGHAPDDLEGDAGLAPRPADQLAGIAVVREDALDKGKPAPGSLQDALRPVAVLDVGAVNLDREQPAVGVGQGEASNAMGSSETPNALASMDAFSGVIAFGSPF